MNINEVLSPKLLELQIKVKSEGKDALKEFWDNLEKIGAPLIEALDNDDEHRLVTFIVKAEDGFDRYVLVSSIAGYELEQNIFNRLEGTDVLFKSYTVLNKARTTYYIAKDIPLDFGEIFGDWEKYIHYCFADPFNKRKFLWPKNPEVGDNNDFYNSIFEMPDAPLQPWIEEMEGIPRGSLEVVRFKSKVLDNERDIWVYTPFNYDKGGEPYHLLLTFDGFEYINVDQSKATLDNLIGENKIHPVVGVFIGNVGKGTRDVELTCNESFAKFMAEELIPWVREKYNVTEDPSKTIAAGASFGGLASTFVGLKYSQLVGNILSQSGSYWFSPEGEEEKEWLIRQYVNSDKLPLKFYLEVGKLESKDSMIATNRHFRDILQCKGYQYYYKEFVGGHDHACWRGTLADGLMKLIGTSDIRYQK